MKNYPTMLYLDGDRTKPYVIVADEAEEEDKRSQGYASLRDAKNAPAQATDEQRVSQWKAKASGEAPRKPGRPKKNA